MIRYMLDTNIVSYLLRNRPAGVREHLSNLKEDEEACISVITEAEILYGLAKRPQAAQLQKTLYALLANLVIIPWDSSAAVEYAELRAQSEKAGRNVGNLDMLIAAHAIAERAVLVTNEKAFSNLQGDFKIVNWADDAE